MIVLVVNILRGVKKRLFQYIGIGLLLIIIVATMTGLYGSSDRIQSAFFKVEENSGTYDYRIKIENLNDYKDINQALEKIKEVVKKQFPKDLPDYDEISTQIKTISVSNIQNNSLPNEILNEKLRTYLWNWGINYKAILVNDILNTDVRTDSGTSYYKIVKSFLKSFNYQDKIKKLFFTFEDGFYINDIPFPWISASNIFDFSPKRNGINEIYIVEGNKALAIDEVVINPTFAKKNNILLNSEFEFLPEKKLKVVGFGYTYLGIIPPFSLENINANPNNTTAVFVTREWLNNYLEKNSSYFSALQAFLFLKVTNKDMFVQDKLESIFNRIFDFSSGSLIVSNSEDLRSGFIRQSFDMQNIIYSAISFIVLLAAIFIVLSYVKKEIEIQKKQIGLIKALGYNNNEISFGYTLLFFLLSIISTTIGFFLGLPLQLYFNNLSNFDFFLPLSPIYFSLISLIIGVFVTTIIFSFFSYLQAYSSLTKNILFLIYDRSTSVSSKWLSILKKPFNYWKFKPRLAASFALKSVGKLFLIFFIFVFATFLLMFENVAIDIVNSKIDNFYNYLNKDIYYNSETISMYNFNSSGKIQSQIFDWTIEKNLDLTKEIKSDTFKIDSKEKYDNLKALISKDDMNYKGYFISSFEINKLYKNINNSNNCLEYIRPVGTDFISQLEAKFLCSKLKQFFDLVIDYSGVNPQIQSLPGFSIGQNIINNEYYPNLEFRVSAPANWIGHKKDSLILNRSTIISLYNSSNLDNPLAWKNWFNLKEEKGYDIDSIFNSSHNLIKEKVTYVDGFGKIRTENAYVVPTVISKVLAILNKYKVNTKELMIINFNGFFIPVIFDIKGITTINLDTSVFYVNIDDLRQIIGFTYKNQPIADSFNNFYSKSSKSVLPLNSINIAQIDNDYSLEGLQSNRILINKIPVIIPLIKDRLGQMFNSIRDIIEISKWLTIIALVFVLAIIVNMILDNNLLIIAMMKSLGYRINEINLLIIGSYIFTLLLAFILGAVLSYVTWGIILWIVAKLSSTVFLLVVNAVTIILSFLLIFFVIIIGYVVGLYFIKFKPVVSLLQSN